MRDIKFRAWWKPYKKMIYSGDLALPNITFGGVCVRPIRTVVNGLELSIDDNISYEYDLMQYTGLHDKNGKDLDWWEGDMFNVCSTIRKIVFEDGCYWFKAVFPNKVVHQRQLCADTIHELDYLPEKLGNIHDNPELLKGT